MPFDEIPYGIAFTGYSFLCLCSVKISFFYNIIRCFWGTKKEKRIIMKKSRRVAFLTDGSQLGNPFPQIYFYCVSNKKPQGGFFNGWLAVGQSVSANLFLLR